MSTSFSIRAWLAYPDGRWSYLVKKVAQNVGFKQLSTLKETSTISNDSDHCYRSLFGYEQKNKKNPFSRSFFLIGSLLGRSLVRSLVRSPDQQLAIHRMPPESQPSTIIPTWSPLSPHLVPTIIPPPGPLVNSTYPLCPSAEESFSHPRGVFAAFIIYA